MTDAILVNGFESGDPYLQGGYNAEYGQEPTPEISDQQLEQMLESDLFRESLQNMVAERLPSLAISASLPYGGRVVGPVTPVGDIHGVDTLNYSKGEKVLRGKLASCYRLADISGWSQGVDTYLSARLAADNNIIIAPQGVMYDEVTASSLIKVSFKGDIVDNGTTTLGVDRTAVAVHAAAYSANKDVSSVIHVASSPAVSVSTMKCGLLPLSQEAMACGEIGYAEFSGDLRDVSDIHRAFSANVKVVFVRNYGVLVAGDSIEEAFMITSNVMTAVVAQMSLVPVGLTNLYLPSAETRNEAFNQSRQLPLGVTTNKRWGYGELEFEGLMRQLDNAGYRTGHVYHDRSTSYRGRSSSEADVSQKKLSIARDTSELSSLNLTVHRKGALAAEWVVSPNVYHREEAAEQSANQKVTRWVSEVSNRPNRSVSSLKSHNANQFAPLGSNPHELRQKVKEIRREYFEDSISAGPQSTVLEGVTWDEARRIKEGQMTVGGIDNVRVTAASRGIIQREHQQEALFYKNYAQQNPFERITKDDLEAYKQEVERKTKRGYGKGAGGYTSCESEAEYVPDNRPMSAPPPQNLSFSLPPQPFSYTAGKTDSTPIKAQYSPQTSALPPVSPRSAAATTDDEVFARDMSRSHTMPLPKQQALEVRGTTPTDQEQAVKPTPSSSSSSPPAAVPQSVSESNFPQRTQSARFPPEKRPELKDEFQRNVKASKSMRQPDKKKSAAASAVSDNEAYRSAGPESKEGSEAGTLKKKKRAFRFPSFSKKSKDKQ